VNGIRAAPLARGLAVLAFAAVAPLFFSAGGDVLNNMVLTAAYVVMAPGLNIIVGYAGLIDLGYVAFFAIGAYTAAYFGSGFWANAGSDGRGIAILVGDFRGRYARDPRQLPAHPRACRRGDGGRRCADRRADAAAAR